MNKKQIAITLGIMCLLLTIAICVQIRTMNSASSTVSQTLADNELRDQVLRMKERYDNAYRELESAQKNLEKVRQAATQNDSDAEAKEQELKENNMLLGRTDVTGEGVEILLEDAKDTANSLNPSEQIIHYDDIQLVINELKNAGAEAIEVNGQRLVSTSAITCEGNIIKINGEDTNKDTNQVLSILKENQINTFTLTIQRGKEEIKKEITPENVSKYYLGVNMKKAPDNIKNRIIYGSIETKNFIFSIADNVKQLFTGRVGVDQMVGPIGIGEVVSKTSGIREFVSMMALISISLGVTNLLPIPALDGGKILILIIEAIRRKPMKQENEINIQLIGFSILIALSIYVSYNDILRLF